MSIAKITPYVQWNPPSGQKTGSSGKYRSPRTTKKSSASLNPRRGNSVLTIKGGLKYIRYECYSLLIVSYPTREAWIETCPMALSRRLKLVTFSGGSGNKSSDVLLFGCMYGRKELVGKFEFFLKKQCEILQTVKITGMM